MHILANPDQHTAQEVQQQYQSLLDEMRQETNASESLQRYLFSGLELRPCDLMQWRTLRHQVESCHEARRQQYRFRKAPVEYLAALEEKLCQRTMRSYSGVPKD